MKWFIRILVGCLVAYIAFFGSVLAAMMQTPDRFGAFMKHVPQALVWAALPGRTMWLSARRGALAEGDAAPDFSLATLDRSARATLSAHRGQRPVVLVFGSYT